MPRRPPTHFEPWHIVFLRANYANHANALLARVLDLPADAIASKAKKLGLAKSAAYLASIGQQRIHLPSGAETCRLQPGHTPPTKGIKRPPGWAPGDMAKTQFRKGQQPVGTMPIGSYRINPDGSLALKFGDAPGPDTNRWIRVHRKVWQDAHGPIPARHCVVFRGGQRITDPALITLDAIELISLEEQGRRRAAWLHSQPNPLREITHARAALTRAINTRLKDMP